MKLSIITVNLNNSEGLLKTIRSVQSQVFKEFELIVIDGASTDNSLEIIQQNNDIIQYYLSEKDHGIYNAMNKGIQRAKGEYCLFLNSGDCFYDEFVLKNVFSKISGNESVVYGNSYKIKPHYRRVIKYKPKLTLYDFYKTVPALHHQASFIKSELFSKYGLYDEKIQIIADWEFFFRVIILNEVETKYIDLIVSTFDGTGLSNSLPKGSDMRMKANIMKNNILSENFPGYILSDYQMFDEMVSRSSVFSRMMNKLKYFSLKL